MWEQVSSHAATASFLLIPVHSSIAHPTRSSGSSEPTAQYSTMRFTTSINAVPFLET